MTANVEQTQRQKADVGAQRIAHTYALALLSAADKENQSRETLEEFEALVGEVFSAKPELETFLSSMAISRDAKGAVLRKTFAGRVSQVFTNFLLVVNDHDRLDLLRSILAAYRAEFEARSARVRVYVRSAVPLPDDQRDRLTNELREVLHREPVLDMKVDPTLLGGLEVRVGDHLFDGSVRTRIDTIKKQLLERSSHEIQSGRDRFSSW
jgi:F-type H+-transporting ATPase subunit delta